jgi:hypothetical protein
MALYKNINITWQFLDANPGTYFVFGDNLQKYGKGGAARLRGHPHALGFITKKFPDNQDGAFYTPEEYLPIFYEELKKLEQIIKHNPTKTFYISKLGGGLANRFKIWETLIQPRLTKELSKYENIVFCWEEETSC